MPPFVNLACGWYVAYILTVTTWGLLAPVVAEKVRVRPVPQVVCPMLDIRHGIGSDLKTYTIARDVCATTDTLLTMGKRDD